MGKRFTISASLSSYSGSVKCQIWLMCDINITHFPSVALADLSWTLWGQVLSQMVDSIEILSRQGYNPVEGT